jgi:plasmid stabilization system protein ParE
VGLRTVVTARGIVAYRVLDDEIEVIRVFAGGRDYERILRGEDS